MNVRSAVTARAENPNLTQRLRSRVARRLLPYLFSLYIIAFLDRVNVSYAAIGMASDLHLAADQLGFGLGIFFVGYFSLEIPSAVLVEKWSAKKWISGLMVIWGCVATTTGFINSPLQFYILRFSLGLAEAGFFPGIIVYLTHWFTGIDRSKAVALFMTAVPFSYVVGSPISSMILRLTWFHLAGWRLVFIIEGLPAVILGIWNIWYLDDSPADATWLNKQDRDQLQAAIDNERCGKILAISTFGYLRNRIVVVMTAVLFLSAAASYGFSLWLPTMVKDTIRSSPHDAALASGIPYAISVLSMILFGWHSDFRRERRWHTAIPMFLASLGFLMASVLTASRISLAISMLLVGSGIYSFLPSFWGTSWGRASRNRSSCSYWFH